MGQTVQTDETVQAVQTDQTDQTRQTADRQTADRQTDRQPDRHKETFTHRHSRRFTYMHTLSSLCTPEPAHQRESLSAECSPPEGRERCNNNSNSNNNNDDSNHNDYSSRQIQRKASIRSKKVKDHISTGDSLFIHLVPRINYNIESISE